MSPNGTLLAYSTPVDIKELRDQAALISIVWKENCQGRQKPSVSEQRKDSTRNNDATLNASQSSKSALKTLTVQSQNCNILVRSIQPELLLVLVGNIPPKKSQSFKINAEGVGDPRFPPFDAAPSRSGSSSNLLLGDAASDGPDGSNKGKAPSLMSNMSQREKDVRLGVLHVQRKRLDALADHALRDFESSGFVMPADSDLQ
jgi:hypothetical protein